MDPLSKWIWTRTPVDPLVFEPPQHDGNDPKEIARELHHRLIVQRHADGAFRLQWGFLWTALLLAAIGTQTTGGPAGIGDPLMGVFAFLVGLTGALLAAPVLTASAAGDADRQEIAGLTARTFLREVPEGTPGDLNDPYLHGWLTADGRPAGAEITRYDASTDEANRRTGWWFQAVVALGLGLAAIFALPWVLGLIVAVMLWWKYAQDRRPLQIRARALEDEAGDEAAMYVAAGGSAWAVTIEEARQAQMESAAKDPSPFFALGTATGILAGRGDPFAPTAGLPFGRTLFDLQQHELVLGGTGSGKTSGVLRPTAKAAAGWDIGMVIMDGKGSLPRELADLPDMQLVTPGRAVLSLVGEDPHEFINTLEDTLGSGEGEARQDPFFRKAAADLGRQAAVLCHAAGGPYWSALSVYQAASSEAFQKEIVNAIPDAAVTPAVERALRFFLESWAATDQKTRANILSTLRSWFAVLEAHPELALWANACPQDDTVSLKAPLRGGRIALHVPPYRYGDAANVVTALIKTRFYGWIRGRAEHPLGDDETHVLLIVDEAQEVLTRADAEILPIARSLGLAVIASTQNVEGVRRALGEIAGSWLNTFRNIVCLQNDSVESFSFVADKLPAVWGAGIGARADVRATVATGLVAATKSQSFMTDIEAAPEGGKGIIGRIMSALAPVDLHAHRTVMGQGGEKPAPTRVLVAEELGDLLAVPHTALCLATRGRVPRRDIVRLRPVFAEAGPALADDSEEPGEAQIRPAAE